MRFDVTRPISDQSKMLIDFALPDLGTRSDEA
jgi:hypothetical protein